MDPIALFLADARHSLDKGEPCLAFAIDFRKAYDTVWNEGLMVKLKDLYMVRGCLSKWLNNFLTTRRAIVVYGVHPDHKQISLWIRIC